MGKKVTKADLAWSAGAIILMFLMRGLGYL